MSITELAEHEQRVGRQIQELCDSLSDEAVEHILVAGLIAFAATRGFGTRFDQAGWCVLVERSERVVGRS